MIKFLYTNIGRGHPFYLDGIVGLLKQDGRLKFECHDVFEISKDPALLAWRMARWFYQVGSTDSIVGKWYNSIRDKSEFNKNGLAMRIMGQDLRKRFMSDETPLVVDHPVLVGILRGKKNLIYQHGEIAVPPQSVAPGADYVFVPVESSAVPFINAGYHKNQIIVTGLCIEPDLVKQSEIAYQNRLNRYSSDVPITGAYFSSGAEPKPHVTRLFLSAHFSTDYGFNVFVFAQKGGKIEESFRPYLQTDMWTSSVIDAGKELPNPPSQFTLCLYEDRHQLDKLTSKFFEKFDYFAAPSHERTSWALGMGLPMIILEPSIGPFAPLNRQVLYGAGVATSLVSQLNAFESRNTLLELRRSGHLAKMAQAGWKKHSINGFQVITEFLINKYVPNA